MRTGRLLAISRAGATNFMPQWMRVGPLLSLEVLKYSGFLLMILDHLNAYLWSRNYEWITHAGRVVFPIFALVLGCGLRKSPRLLQQVLLLWACGLAAEGASVTLERGELNVLFTLGCGVLACWGLQRGGVFGYGIIALALGAASLSEYGPLGAALVLAAWVGSMRGIWMALAGVSLLQLNPVPLVVPLMFWAADRWCGGEAWRSPKGLFAIGYVAQWAVISVVAVGL